MEELSKAQLSKWVQQNSVDCEINDPDGIYQDYLSLHSKLLDLAAGDGKTGGVYKLRGTVVWKVVAPARAVVHHFRLSRQVLQHGGMAALGRRYADFFNPKIIGVKAYNLVNNSGPVRKRRGAAFLQQILPTEEIKRIQRETVFQTDVTFSILVPLFNTPERFLRDMIESVIAQTYGKWELCLADASTQEHPQVERIAAEYAAKDKRIVYKKLEKNRGISDNTNACMEMAAGNYICLFDHDDILHPSALFEVMKKIEEEGAEFIYTDEATFQGDSLETLIAYHFKPDYSPDNLRGVNYICHLTTFKTSLLEVTGGFSNEYDGSQDHDIILKLTDAAAVVSHVPQILYFWRSHSLSVSKDIGAKMYCIDAGIHAVEDAEARRGYPAKAYSSQICLTHYRLQYELKEKPLVSILVHGGKEEAFANTLNAIAKKTSYENYEVLTCGFTAREIAKAVQEANGSYYVFLESGNVPVQENWIEEMLMFAQRLDVGAVGGRVVSSENIVIHADKIFSLEIPNLFMETDAGAKVRDMSFMGRMYYAHNVSAVSGQAMMTRAEYFIQAGGFDCDYKTDGYDFDYCFRLRKLGYHIVVNPYVVYQNSWLKDTPPLSAASVHVFKKRWKEELEAGDPYYNPNLSFDRLWEMKHVK